MRYVERLLQDIEYVTLVKKQEEAEADRRFCRHGLSHFLDVARIAWIMCFEEAAEEHRMLDGWEKEQIYLTALLHDLGRLAERKEGIPHHQAGADLAKYFLKKIDWPLDKQQEILNAIQGHRGEEKLNNEFTNLIKKADNKSRNCFFCDMQEACNWNCERKNKTIQS
ncbi:MAG: HD domain-containing protein [Lachnospiraceae bacterium]|nr:HD domain-containing protein [Lachnospiraceae bacterium]